MTFFSSDETGKKVISRQWLDWLFVIQLVFVIGALTTMAAYTIITANRVAELNRVQVEFAIDQNEQALCNQHDMIVAVKLIGERLNIIRTEDIPVPSTEGFDCDASLP